MTTYILHGGITKTDNENNRAFFRMMADGLPENGTWLVVFFASEDPSQNTRKFQEECDRIKVYTQNKIIHFEMATEENFPQQLAKADVVYFRGGRSSNLMRIVKQWPNLKSWLSNCKVVAGSSAGANMLCRDFVGRDVGLMQGLGLIPMGMVVHYQAPEFLASQDISQRERPLLMLQETQFCVIEM
jgi:peptidase E